MEWAPLGIRVNCIVARPARQRRRRGRAFLTLPQIRERMLADIPARRFKTLDDVVASALFLLSGRRGARHGRDADDSVDGGQALSQGMFRHSPIPQRP